MEKYVFKRKPYSNLVHSYGTLCSLKILLPSSILTLLLLHYWSVQLDEVAFWQVLRFSQLLPPFPPGLCVLQGHLSPDSMDEQHFEKLWLILIHKPPSLCFWLCLQGSALRWARCIQNEGFQNRQCKTHNCTLHCRPVYWNVCALFSQTVRRPWQTVNRTESIFSLCGIWMAFWNEPL